MFLPLHLFYYIWDDYCFTSKRPWPFWTWNDLAGTHSSKVKRELICELSPIPCSAPCSLKDKFLFQINPDYFSNTLAFGLPCWTVLWHNPDRLPIAMKKSFLASEVNSLNEVLDFPFMGARKMVQMKLGKPGRAQRLSPEAAPPHETLLDIYCRAKWINSRRKPFIFPLPFEWVLILHPKVLVR